VLWGSNWDPLLAKDTSGMLRQRMEECVDGEYQDFKSKNGAYVRQHFFGKYPETAALVKDWSDDEIWALRRGGSDPVKVYAAYAAAIEYVGQPTDSTRGSGELVDRLERLARDAGRRRRSRARRLVLRNFLRSSRHLAATSGCGATEPCPHPSGDTR
jgi:hypothetical protein